MIASVIIFLSVYFLPTIIACFNGELSAEKKFGVFLFNLLSSWAILPWFISMYSVIQAMPSSPAPIKEVTTTKKKRNIYIKDYDFKEYESFVVKYGLCAEDFYGDGKAYDGHGYTSDATDFQKGIGVPREHKEYLCEYREKFLVDKYGKLSEEDMLMSDEIEQDGKEFLLKEIYNYNEREVNDLLITAEAERQYAEQAKIRAVKRKISQKARELYQNVPEDEKTRHIPDDVKEQIWRRDEGKCVKCGSNEKLEFDHIIPFSKGGSNTARNIQLLCEKCNRSKKDSI